MRPAPTTLADRPPRRLQPRGVSRSIRRSSRSRRWRRGTIRRSARRSARPLWPRTPPPRRVHRALLAFVALVLGAVAGWLGGRSGVVHPVYADRMIPIRRSGVGLPYPGLAPRDVPVQRPPRTSRKENSMKNPWMSMWLSAANKAAGAARGFGTAELHRQQKAIAKETARAMGLGPPTSEKRAPCRAAEKSGFIGRIGGGRPCRVRPAPVRSPVRRSTRRKDRPQLRRTRVARRFPGPPP